MFSSTNAPHYKGVWRSGHSSVHHPSAIDRGQWSALHSRLLTPGEISLPPRCPLNRKSGIIWAEILGNIGGFEKGLGTEWSLYVYFMNGFAMYTLKEEI